MKNNWQFMFLAKITSTCLVLASCGGDSGGGATTSKTVTGKVLDGHVSLARVCFDQNGDRQCTTTDNYTTSSSDGSYELSVSEEIIETYELIADVRYSEAKDTDYADGIPDYDYVMNGFNVSSGKENNISPISSYMDYKQTKDSLTVIETEEYVETQIIVSEQFTYRDSIATNPINLSEYLTKDFIVNKESNNPYVADFNTRLHNLNEVFARELQESQAYWENSYNNGSYTPESSLWSDNSRIIVENSRYNVYENFESIVEQVTSVDFTSFDAALIATSLQPTAPNAAQLEDYYRFLDYLEQVDQEFSGSTYRYDTHSSSEYGNFSVSSYIQFTSSGIVVYAINEDMCIQQAVPMFPYTGQSESQFVQEFNNGLQEAESYGLGFTYSDLIKVSAPPNNCSSLTSLLDNINTPIVSSGKPDRESVSFSEQNYPPSLNVSANMATPYVKEPVPSLMPSNFAPARVNPHLETRLPYAKK